jgi:hypothetical protein
MKEILPQKFSITPVICLGVTKMTELRNKKKRCKYQKQSVITIEHFRFQFYKVFLYSCSFCKLCFKGTPLLAFLCQSSFLIFRKCTAKYVSSVIVHLRLTRGFLIYSIQVFLTMIKVSMKILNI